MIPKDLRYHTEHEWIRAEGKTATLGITHFAQDSLGDIVYLEAPKPGSVLEAGQEIGEVESTKTTSPIYTPVSGKITAVNEALKDQPELINKDPYHDGWIVKIQMNDPAELNALMSADQYAEYLEKEDH
jgi:glycine cleavage system H protein